MDMIEAADLRCAACLAPLKDDDRFCERCGVRLGEKGSESRQCQSCGAPPAAIDADGYCTLCGMRERASTHRVELDLTTAAAVSDQGRVHRRNEDAFYLEAANCGSVAVVCDGVSSATASDLAAQSAAKAAGRVLAEAVGDPSRDADEATLAAISAAQAAVEQMGVGVQADLTAPACTLVSALWRDGKITVGWVGDSRAYWMGPEGTRQLTVDDSWAEEQVTLGLLTAEQAAHDPRFHAITHWVGLDAPGRPPRAAALRPEGRGRLLLCTDGLWNYAETPVALAALVGALPAGAAPAAVARSLTETALARGGHDNITVAVVDIDP